MYPCPIDTFSGAMYASAHVGEKACGVRWHFLQAFATLGVPREIKTGNSLAYVSKQLEQFFNAWGVTHITGIPHSPAGQSIVQRAHQTIKRVLGQQRGGTELSPPIERLSKALFTINFLNNSFTEPTPPVYRHFMNSVKSKSKDRRY